MAKSKNHNNKTNKNELENQNIGDKQYENDLSNIFLDKVQKSISSFNIIDQDQRIKKY
jgi:hypothetical protein